MNGGVEVDNGFNGDVSIDIVVLQTHVISLLSSNEIRLCHVLITCCTPSIRIFFASTLCPKIFAFLWFKFFPKIKGHVRGDRGVRDPIYCSSALVRQSHQHETSKIKIKNLFFSKKKRQQSCPSALRESRSSHRTCSVISSVVGFWTSITADQTEVDRGHCIGLIL
jgi:hypothetical protein